MEKMRTLFVLLVLLLAGTAGAQSEERIQKHDLAVMARQQVEKEAQAISDSCAKALEKDLVSIFGKTYIVDLEHFADTQTILCPICRKDWYKGSNTLILKHNGKIIDRIKGVKLFPPQQIFQWYSLPSHRGDGPVTHEHGKHSCVLYFDGIAIKELSRQQVKVTVTDTCFDPAHPDWIRRHATTPAKRPSASKWQPPEKPYDLLWQKRQDKKGFVYNLTESRLDIIELHALLAAQVVRLDSLEAKIGRAHVVAVRDSEYVKVDRFLTDGMGDTTYLPSIHQWEFITRYIISFEPEGK